MAGGIITRRIGTTVEIRHADVPLFAPQRARGVLTDVARTYFGLALQVLAGHISDKAPVGVSGSLAQSFASDVHGEVLESLTGRVFSDLPHAIVIDQGREPGSRMPPVEALMTWVRRVLNVGGDEKEVRQVAFLVARAIGKKGIKARHFVDKGVEASTAELEGLFAVMGEAMAAALVTNAGVRPSSGGVGI